MASRDSIVEEVRAVREALAEEFDCDAEKIAEAIKAEEAASGRKLESHPPKRIEKEQPAGQTGRLNG